MQLPFWKLSRRPRPQSGPQGRIHVFIFILLFEPWLCEGWLVVVAAEAKLAVVVVVVVKSAGVVGCRAGRVEAKAALTLSSPPLSPLPLSLFLFCFCVA